MTKVLGLDLGTNSIGWALIDKSNNTILGTGSRIFPEGVENIGDGDREVSKSASRTEDRGKRRQFFRQRLRKRYLLRLLAQHDLCPIEYNSVKVWNAKEVFSNPDVIEWLSENPYELRAKAMTEKLTLHQLGRIFYHMIQRRGFLSNSRSAGSDDNEKSVIFTGDSKIGKTGISETQEQVEKNKTLGLYLNEIYPQPNEPYRDGVERIRNRYTTRQMYVDEFELIWAKQADLNSSLTEELKSLLGGRKKEGHVDDGVLFSSKAFEVSKTSCG